MENVRAMFSNKGGQVLRLVVRAITSMGYQARDFLLIYQSLPFILLEYQSTTSIASNVSSKSSRLMNCALILRRYQSNL